MSIIKINNTYKFFGIIFLTLSMTSSNSGLMYGKDKRTLIPYRCYDHDNPFQPFTQLCSQKMVEDQTLENAIELYDRIYNEMTYNECSTYCSQAKTCDQCIGIECDISNYCYQCHLDSFDNYKHQSFNTSLDPRCTYRSLRSISRSNRMFLQCDSLQDEYPNVLRDPPCFSRRLHHPVHQAITEISHCFYLDPKAIFTLIVNESSAHPLITNPAPFTTATGLGQLTGSFVDHHSNTNFTTYDNYKNHILDILGPQCAVVKNKLKNLPKLEDSPLCRVRQGIKNCQGTRLCQRTSPYLNVFYTAMAFLEAIHYIVPKVLRSRQISIPVTSESPLYLAINSLEGQTRTMFTNLAKFQNMPQDDKNIVTELAFYSHILPTTHSFFQTYLNANQGRLPNFAQFRGANGQWVSFLKNNKHLLPQRESTQDAFIEYLYNRYSPSQIKNIGYIERGDGQRNEKTIFGACRPY